MKITTLLRPSGHEGPSGYDGPPFTDDTETVAQSLRFKGIISFGQIGSIVEERPGAMAWLAAAARQAANEKLAAALGQQVASGEVTSGYPPVQAQSPEQTEAIANVPAQPTEQAPDLTYENGLITVLSERAAAAAVPASRGLEELTNG